MTDLGRKLLALALIVALPSLGCFSYYAAEDAHANNPLAALAIVLSYPALLISLATVIALRLSKRPHRLGLALAGTCLIASAAILLWARL